MKKSNRIFVLNWLLVLLWMAVIYYFSDQPSLKSNFQPMWDVIFRKVAHMAEYFVLAYLLWRALSYKNQSENITVLLIFIISLIYAMLDEYHQNFVFGRHGSIFDVMIDSIGVVLFIVMNKFKNLLRLV